MCAITAGGRVVVCGMPCYDVSSLPWPTYALPRRCMLESLPGSPECLRRSVASLPSAAAASPVCGVSPLPARAESPRQQQHAQLRAAEAEARGRPPQDQARRRRRVASASPDSPWGGDAGGWRDAGGGAWDGVALRGLAGLKASKHACAGGGAWRSSSLSPPRPRAAAEGGAAAGEGGLVATRLSGRHSPAFREGMAAAEAARRPQHVHGAGIEPHSSTPALRPASASPMARPMGCADAADRGDAAADWAWRPRSRSCSPTLGGRPPQRHETASRLQQQQQQQQQRRWQRYDQHQARHPGGGASAASGRGSPERCVLASRCGAPRLAPTVTASGGSGVAASGQGLVLSALLPFGAAEERQRRELAEYVAFTRRLRLFALWREHAQAAQGIGCAASGLDTRAASALVPSLVGNCCLHFVAKSFFAAAPFAST